MLKITFDWRSLIGCIYVCRYFTYTKIHIRKLCTHIRTFSNHQIILHYVHTYIVKFNSLNCFHPIESVCSPLIIFMIWIKKNLNKFWTDCKRTWKPYNVSTLIVHWSNVQYVWIYSILSYVSDWNFYTYIHSTYYDTDSWILYVGKYQEIK